MNIRQMRQILEINNCQSINKAAQKLYISQSALTASVNAVEDELGMKILSRSHSGITLTDFGIKFVDAAERILDIYDNLVLNAASEDNGLKISCQYLRFVGTVFASVCDERSNAEFRYTEHSRDMVIQDVIEGNSDIGIIVTPTHFRSRVYSLLEEHDLTHIPMMQQQCVCLVGPHNPLYNNADSNIVLADLQDYPMLCYEHNSLKLTSDISTNETTVFPHTGSLTISDRGSFHSLLRETKSFFIGVYKDNLYTNSSFYEDVRVLNIQDIEYSYDTILFFKRERKLSSIAFAFIERLYDVIGTPMDPTLFDVQA